MKLLSFTTSSRRKISLSLPLWCLTGALTQMAEAQPTGATQPPSVAGFFSQLFLSVGSLAMLALIAGYFSPKGFAFLFKEKTTKNRVCGTFGAAMLVFGVLGSILEPKPVVTPQEVKAKSEAAVAKDEAKAADERAKLAEARVGEAEARATKAEQDAARANAAVRSAATERARDSNKARSERLVKAKPREEEETAPSATTAPKDDGLPDNVAVMNIPNLGERQIGEVDKVGYVVLTAETADRIGGTQADGTFYIVHVAASNSDKKTHNITTSIMKLLDDQDREFDPSKEGGMALMLSGDQEAQLYSAQVQPGVTKKFTLVYDAPGNAKGLKLKIPHGSFSFSKPAVIAVPEEGE